MYFNPFRFARPPEGTLGNTANGIFRGPGINNWDMSLFKNTRISERVTAQLRFEFFNVFNHTQWDGINTSRTLPNPGPVTEATRGQLGEITSSRDPRNIQLGLKIYF
jgi:TonB dependent receptor.